MIKPGCCISLRGSWEAFELKNWRRFFISSEDSAETRISLYNTRIDMSETCKQNFTISLYNTKIDISERSRFITNKQNFTHDFTGSSAFHFQTRPLSFFLYKILKLTLRYNINIFSSVKFSTNFCEIKINNFRR